MMMAMKMQSNSEFPFSLAAVLVSLVLIQGGIAQGGEDLNVWNVWQGEKTANNTGQSMPIGSGTSHNYNGIQFQVRASRPWSIPSRPALP